MDCSAALLTLTVPDAARCPSVGRVGDGLFSPVGRLGGFRLPMDHVDDAIRTRFLCAHPVVTIDVARNALDVLAHVGCHQLFEASIEAQNLTCMHLDVRGSPLNA